VCSLKDRRPSPTSGFGTSDEHRGSGAADERRGGPPARSAGTRVMRGDQARISAGLIVQQGDFGHAGGPGTLKVT
jgi:hypothetical protein